MQKNSYQSSVVQFTPSHVQKMDINIKSKKPLSPTFANHTTHEHSSFTETRFGQVWSHG